MRHEGNQGRERLMYVIHECRAAGACQEALFCQLARLCLRDHIRAQRRLNDGVEAQLLQSRDDLPQFSIGKLAGNRGRDHGKDLVLGVALALFDHVDHVENEGLVRNGTEGAGIHAGAAGNALGIVDARLLLVTHGDCLDLAGGFAGAAIVVNGAVRADLGAGAALLALALVDVRHMVGVKGERAEAAHILAPVRKASAARRRDLVTADRAFVAGDINDLNHVGVVLIAAHGYLDALGQDRALLVYTAAHGRDLARDDGLGDVDRAFRQTVCPCFPRDFPQDLIFQMLYLCIKLSHGFFLFLCFPLKLSPQRRTGVGSAVSQK